MKKSVASDGSSEKTNDKSEDGTVPRWMYYLAVYYIILMIISIWSLIQTVFAPVGNAPEVRIPLLWLSKEQVPPITEDSHLIIVSLLQVHMEECFTDLHG